MANSRFAWVIGAMVFLLSLPTQSNAQLPTTLSLEDTFNLEFPASPFFLTMTRELCVRNHVALVDGRKVAHPVAPKDRTKCNPPTQ